MGNNSTRKGFTLAEVLITLGIIGVVAALTIPTILHNVQEMVLKNQFKKFYSQFWQAAIGIQTKEGRPIQCFYWQNNTYPGTCTAKCTSENEYGTCKSLVCAETGESMPSDYHGHFSDCTTFGQELFYNTFKTAKICESNAYDEGCLPEDFRGADVVKSELDPDTEQDPDVEYSDSNVKNNYPVIVLADGTYIIPYSNIGSRPVYVFDINGHKGPNKWGYDIFTLHLEGNLTNGIQGVGWSNYATDKGGKTGSEMYEEAFQK